MRRMKSSTDFCCAAERQNSMAKACPDASNLKCIKNHTQYNDLCWKCDHNIWLWKPWHLWWNCLPKCCDRIVKWGLLFLWRRQFFYTNTVILLTERNDSSDQTLASPTTRSTAFITITCRLATHLTSSNSILSDPQFLVSFTLDLPHPITFQS